MAVVQLTAPTDMRFSDNFGTLVAGSTPSGISGHASEFWVASANSGTYQGLDLIGDFTFYGPQFQFYGMITEAWFGKSVVPSIHITGLSFAMSLPNWSAYVYSTPHLDTLLDGFLLDDDIIIGSAGADVLTGRDGNDTLYGGAGADQLLGGSGINTASYATAKAGLFAGLEDANANTGDAFGDTYNAIQNLTGSQFNDTLYGDGGNNILNGLGGNDVMVGKDGADRFDGGAGTDTASYDSSGSGIRADLLAPVTNTGAAAGDSYVSIENLYGSSFSDTLCGNNLGNFIAGNMFPALASGDDFLIGRGGNDTLRGYNGADRLEGDAGVDVLTGGNGNDIFIFNAPLNAVTNRDLITDFANVTNNNDTIHLENAIFTKLGAGAAHLLNPAFFRVGTVALDTNDYIVYNRTTGVLSYNVNGSLAGGMIAFAVITNHAALAYNDFVVI